MRGGDDPAGAGEGGSAGGAAGASGAATAGGAGPTGPTSIRLAGEVLYDAAPYGVNYTVAVWA